MNSINRLCADIGDRLRVAARKCELGLRRRLTGKTVWVRYDWLELPYHGDGDELELSCHLDAAKWWRWWQREWRKLAAHVKPGAVLVDVGANLGIYTALFSKLTGATGLVHSFESSPAAFAKLREVVAMNGLKNVCLHDVNCGGQQGSLEPQLAASSGNPSRSSHPELPAALPETQNPGSVRLDDYLAPQLTGLDFVRIDAQGSGDSVIAGATKMLERFRPVIYVDLASEHLEPSRRTVALLKSLGYHFPVEPVLEECQNGENFIAMPN
jgi:FkbM family methyltransferase